MATDRPIWPQGYDRAAGEDAVPPNLNWDLWLGTAPMRRFQARWPEGHSVYNPENKRMLGPKGTLYHPFSWRGWIEFGSGAVGDIAPHSMNGIFLAVDLSAPSALEVVHPPGLKKGMCPACSAAR